MPKHPHHFAILAIFLGLLSIGLAVVVEVSVKAQSTTGTATTVSNNMRSLTNTTANNTDVNTNTGTNRNANTKNTGNRNADTRNTDAIACSYTYNFWSVCNSTGKQTRNIDSRTPSKCHNTATPVLEQACTYVSPTKHKIDCVYDLSDWSACSLVGTQNRDILSRTPVSCHDSNMPKLQKTCTYKYPVISNSHENTTATNATSSETNSSLDTTTGTTSAEINSSANTTIDVDTSSQSYGVTPSFNFLNINGGEAINDSVKIQGSFSNAQKVEFYLVSTDSNIPKYLGLAKKLDGNVWEYLFDSKTQPNGSYHVKVKVKNVYGSYDGGQRMLIILNAVENATIADSLASDLPKTEDVVNSFPTSEALIRKNTATNNQENQKVAVIVDKISSEWQKKYFKSDVCVDENICGEMADPDKDGINNNDEYRYGANPVNPDSDEDGFLDGDEVKNGYNPLKASPGDKSDKMVFENPKENGEVKKDFYQVNKVELIPAEDGNKKLKLNGKGLPNSFVTIYIYSDPIILTVKTDSEGNWSYEVDKDIEDGEHQVYVAVTDNTGKITAKSEPIMFVKTAEAATIIPPAEATAPSELVSSTKNQTKKDIFFFLTLILGGLSLAMASIGLYKYGIHKEGINNLDKKY